MSKSSRSSNAWHEGLITALAVGGFFIIFGVVFGLAPGVPDAILDFFRDITAMTYPLGSGQVVLPAPANPAAHLDVFGAVFNFMVGIGVLQVAILVLRLLFHSPLRRTAETVGDLVFWFGGAVAANMFLLVGTLTGWFQFWSLIIVLAGASLIARFLVYLTKRF